MCSGKNDKIANKNDAIVTPSGPARASSDTISWTDTQRLGAMQWLALERPCLIKLKQI